MSILPPEENKDCPPAHGNCSCFCHRVPGVKHIMPCCYPSGESKDVSDFFEKHLGENWLLDPDD